jgi:hypothetical protein
MKSRNMVAVFALAVLVLASVAPAAAQTLQAFNIERTIALNNILTGITPTLSPIPTPPAALANLGSALVAVVTMTVDKIYVTTKPFMSVMFVGTDTQSTATPYGTYQGAASAISAGFTSDTPAKVNTVIETVAGAIVLYSPAATVNTLTVTTPPPSGGGGTPSGPTAVITPANQTVVVKEVTLDASQSTDPSGLALTYQWSVVGSGNVSILHGNSAVATAQLGDNGPNTYTFKVTVTNSTGQSASATTTVSYVGR